MAALLCEAERAYVERTAEWRDRLPDLLADQVHATDLELDRMRDELGRLRRENESLRTEVERSAARPQARTSPDATPQTASQLPRSDQP